MNAIAMAAILITWPSLGHSPDRQHRVSSISVPAAGAESFRHGRTVRTNGSSRRWRRSDRLSSGVRVESVAHTNHVPARWKEISTDSIAKLQRSLLEYAKLSKRGMASVALSLQVLNALSASTAAEFHARISALPINITRRVVDGQILTEYRLRGVLKASRMTPLQSPETSSGARLQFETRDDVPYAASDAQMPPAVPVLTQISSTDCEYTDADNYYWSGECATQEDIDDAYATAVALDSDSDGAQAEIDVDVDYCRKFLDSCYETEPNFLTSERRSVPQPLWSASLPASSGHGPYAAEACSYFQDCTEQAVAAAAAVAAYGWKAYKLWGVISAVAPPINAIGDAIIGATTTLAAVVVAGSALKRCVYET